MLTLLSCVRSLQPLFHACLKGLFRPRACCTPTQHKPISHCVWLVPLFPCMSAHRTLLGRHSHVSGHHPHTRRPVPLLRDWLSLLQECHCSSNGLTVCSRLAHVHVLCVQKFNDCVAQTVFCLLQSVVLVVVILIELVGAVLHHGVEPKVP